MSKKFKKKLINLRENNFIDKGIDFGEFKKILKRFNFKDTINISGYYPINNEISCLDILANLKKNYKISLPVTKKNNNMDFYEWSFQDPLKVSGQGIPEPDKKSHSRCPDCSISWI